jgi:hypothetical protein
MFYIVIGCVVVVVIALVAGIILLRRQKGRDAVNVGRGGQRDGRMTPASTANPVFVPMVGVADAMARHSRRDVEETRESSRDATLPQRPRPITVFDQPSDDYEVPVSDYSEPMEPPVEQHARTSSSVTLDRYLYVSSAAYPLPATAPRVGPAVLTLDNELYVSSSPFTPNDQSETGAYEEPCTVFRSPGSHVSADTSA